MSDSDEDFNPMDFKEVHEQIKKFKSNPDTRGMFVSGWDDADQDIDIVTNPEENPIHHVLSAAENGDVTLLKTLLSSKPNLVHAQDEDGYTPLHRAAYGNHVKALSYLISVGADVTKRTELGWTPLHSACNWNNYSAAARLLAAGADPAALSDGKQTPLHLAAAVSHSKSTLLILMFQEEAVEISKKKNKSEETAEQLATRHGIYAPLFEIVLPAVCYIKSQSFTCNPHVRSQTLLNSD